MQTLHETYRSCFAAKSVARSSQLEPICHTTQKAHVEITLNAEGRYLPGRARVLGKDEADTLVPCTEKSSGRSGKQPCCHPLCDKLQYVAGDFVTFGGEVTSGFADDPGQPHRDYLEALSNWAASQHGHPKLNAVLTYVRQGQVVADLVRDCVLPAVDGKLLKEWAGQKKDAPAVFGVLTSNQGVDECFVRWRVEIPGMADSTTWDDKDLQQAWIRYYTSRGASRGLCLVTGSETELAEQHPAKLRHGGDKAKLVSSNDTNGFTFRGRFIDAAQACGIGFEVTQQAHNALRWLIETQGFRNDDAVIVSWAVSGKAIPEPRFNTYDIFAMEPEPAEPDQPMEADAGQAFALRLKRLIGGYRSRLGSTESVVVLGLESATPGRMAVTYYRALQGSEFLDRIEAWHKRFAWHQRYSKEVVGVFAPAPKEIAAAAFGRQLDDKLSRTTVERLYPCIIDGRSLPRDLMESACRRAANRNGFDGKTREDKERAWEKTLGIACALFRGYHAKENYQMTLETDRRTRDYLYGRLLAVADRLESVALSIAQEKRETSAARLMQRFADHPYSTWRTIYLSLAPYKARLRGSREAFLHRMEKEIDAIKNAFDPNDFIKEGKLSGEFLLGFHCQRMALRPKDKENDGDGVDADASADSDSINSDKE